MQLALEALLVPARVALRAEEDGALVVVDAVDGVAELAREVGADFRADQAGRSGDEKVFMRSSATRRKFWHAIICTRSAALVVAPARRRGTVNSW